MRCGRSGDWACTEDKVTPARNAELVKRQSVTRQISGSTSAQAAGAVLSFRLPDGEQEQANSAFCCRGPAQVAKSVDARDLKSLGLCRAGSSPALGTILIKQLVTRICQTQSLAAIASMTIAIITLTHSFPRRLMVSLVASLAPIIPPMPMTMPAAQ